jgi:hypothetical protein
MRTLRIAVTLAFAALVCGAGGSTPSRAGEVVLFPYTFKCPAGWRAEGPGPAGGLTWCSGSRQGNDAFRGELRLFAFSFCPEAAPDIWAEAKGAVLPINRYAALFSLLGTTFGGDRKESFALPNVPNAPAHTTWCIAFNGVYPNQP